MAPPALQPLIVGLGRSGAGLHLKVLQRIPTGPPVACDPRPEAGRDLHGVTVTRSLADAARLLTPAHTVVHVCTPPATRPAVIAELAAHGFTKLLVDKPLALDDGALDEVLRLRRRHDLDMEVVTQWLAADLTHELRRLVRERPLGPLRSISVAQHKPRFLRTLVTEGTGEGHPSALDVEIPHSLGVVLDLAGPARLRDAHWHAMRCGDAVRPRMGGTRLTLEHASGVRTEIASDLTSPIQQRSFTLRFERGTATGHFPLSEHDDHAQLVIETGEGRHVHVFRDDSLTAFVRRAYQRFPTGRRADFAPYREAARLLCAAKEHCRRTDDDAETDTETDPEPRKEATCHAP